MTEEFDYVIVGAGSAGCVLANRLSEDPQTSVVIIEAGGEDRSRYIRVPAGVIEAMHHSEFNWDYYSEPEPALNHRRSWTPRGKVLGGSSSINGMMYVRGNALDYERWVELGASGWSYAEVLPYFKRAESFDQGADSYRGDRGPLRTTRGPRSNPLFDVFVEAGVQAGYPKSADLNGYQQEGFGAADMTVADGLRWSTARGYLHPQRRRPNLKVETRAHVREISVAGNRASGVVFARGGVPGKVAARREVILAAGAANSPQLLMLSGIGPGEHLRELGIPVRQDLPGVGGNLMDHLCVYLLYECLEPVSLQPALRPVGRFKAGLQWLLFGSGLATTTHWHASGFIRSRAGIEWPDMQLDFMPFAMLEDLSIAPVPHGFSTHVGPLRPSSRGTVRLRSSDPMEAPRLQFNYLSDERDWETMRACVRLTREIHRQPAFDRYRGRELLPGDGVQSAGEIDDFIRDNAGTVFHLSGTCKMGMDARAVVDPACRVHGVEGLRVVDASIMPEITSGNTNAPTIMIAEKVADLIRGLEPPPPAAAESYHTADWETTQRPGRPAGR